jgi:TrmH RNA methyltransferase
MAAALSVLRVHPEQVLSIAHTEAVRKPLAEALREAARRRIAYREVGEEELAKMAGAVHHEGVCLLVRPRSNLTLTELARRAEPAGLIVALDRVSNPHNVGAVLRSAAFFGAAGMLLCDDEGRGRALTPAATRVAEGGAEHVPVAHVQMLAPALQSLRGSGLTIVGSDVRAELPLQALQWPERAVVVLGSEDEGLAPAVRKGCDVVVRIEGSGALESLNVSVAAGVLLASYRARRRAP